MTCYSNGKFLITGEYLVLHGALALAVPLRFGQSLQVSPSAATGHILWKSYAENKLWFQADYTFPGFIVNSTNDEARAQYLAGLLRAAHNLNPEVLGLANGYDVTARINFNTNWGLGSSSTLTFNIARWFDIDPFDLHFKTSTGSGYDIACAGADSPVLYQLSKTRPVFEPAVFNPAFSHQLYFVYLGKKQDSAKSIRYHHETLKSAKSEIHRISDITRSVVASKTLDEFETLLNGHERILSGILQIPTAKDTFFDGFDGAVKSLGAWGGDFVMVTWRDDSERLKRYLSKRGFDTVFGYNEIVLQPKDGNSIKNEGIAKKQFSHLNKPA